MSGQYLTDVDEKRITQTREQPAFKEPKKYQVILLNDDYTPMEFVVDVLKRFFYLNDARAIQVMLQVHTQGRAVCGVFTHDIAETKVSQVNDYGRANQYPLLCCMEPG